MVCWTTRRAKSAHSASRTPSKKPSSESSLQGCPRASRIGWRSAASSVPLNSKDSKRREGVEGNQIIFEFRSLRRSKDHRSVMLNSKDADRREGLEGNQISFELRNLARSKGLAILRLLRGTSTPSSNTGQTVSSAFWLPALPGASAPRQRHQPRRGCPGSTQSPRRSAAPRE